MVSFTKLKTTVLLTSAALLCTTPLAAALKTKPSTTRVRARTVAPALRLNASPRTSSHNSAKTITASSRRGHKGKLQTVTASKPKFRGQQSIDQARTLEIQQALIREHYLDGEATGEWDQATRDALTRFQGDNHWQIKILPDARALIKLGLGPSPQKLLNPESAAIAIPYQAGLQKQARSGSN
jgi:Putative peptidoglycan binding domain